MKELALAAVIFACLFVFSPDSVHADSFTVDDWCSTVGDWDDSDDICYMRQDGTIDAGEILFILPGQGLRTGYRLTQHTLHNKGTIEIQDTGGLVNFGTINNCAGGYIYNRPGGVLNNYGGGTLNNYGIIDNKNGPYNGMFNSGTIRNYGWIDNHGRFMNLVYDCETRLSPCGLIINHHTISNQGTFDNHGIIANHHVLLGNPINNWGGLIFDVDNYAFLPFAGRSD